MGVLKMLQLKWSPGGLPPPDSYAGQRVLVTGATSGLGLSAAVHLLNLGAAEVIITARSKARGDAAKAKIESEANTKDKVRVLLLNMDDFASAVDLVDRLRADYSASGGLDLAILNAGVHNASFVQSPGGLEQDVHVNAVATTLLGLLLVSWMKALRPSRATPARLVFVGSGRHIGANTADWERFAAEKPAQAGGVGGILGHLSRPENWAAGLPGALHAYAVSKLLLEYTIQEVARLALGSDGSPAVVVTSVCPGPVQTDLSRGMLEASFLVRLAVPLVNATVFQPPAVGAQVYVDVGLAGPDQHGKFMTRYISDAEYARNAMANVTGPRGQELQRLVWGEIRAILRQKVPAVQGVLD